MQTFSLKTQIAELDNSQASKRDPLHDSMAVRGLFRQLNLLLLCDYRVDGARTVLDHIDALVGHSGHKMYLLSMLGDLPDALKLSRFDGIVIHYSLVISSDEYLSPRARDRIRTFKGLKVVFIQDEYRFVNKTCEALRYLGAHLLFTCVPEQEIEKVYPTGELPGMGKACVLTGYVPESLLGQLRRNYGDRIIDVGYRSRRLPAFYGELAQEKWRIAERFLSDATAYGLKCDISYREEDRLYGDNWEEFLSTCKAVLGVESGASVFDFTGEIEKRAREYERKNSSATFEEVRERCFPGLDGQIRLNQISPRCFEAAALGALMILYEGEYSGVLVPGRHYIPLKKDHSNMREVVAALKDENTWSRITRAAYDEVAMNPRYSYRHFGEIVGEAISARFIALGLTDTPREFYSGQEYEIATRSHRSQIAWQQAQRARFGTLRWRIIVRCVERMPPWLTKPVRILWHAWRRHHMTKFY